MVDKTDCGAKHCEWKGSIARAPKLSRQGEEGNEEQKSKNYKNTLKQLIHSAYMLLCIR